MGFLDKFNPFRKEAKTEATAKTEKAEEPAASSESGGPVCAVCGKAGVNKYWGGQHFHVKCLRKTRKQAKGML